MDRGIVVNGRVLPGSEQVRREAGWWTDGEIGTRPRADIVRKKLYHWTAGEGGTGSYDDDGPRVVAAMKARKRDDGSRMNVGVAFIIGACDPAAPMANIWQSADIGRVATVHVGSGEVNADSIGTEIVSAGLPGPLDSRHRPTIKIKVRGRDLTQLQFFKGQIAAAIWLAEFLSGAIAGAEAKRMLEDAGICIERHVPKVLDAKMTAAELRAYSGGLEHLNVPPHKKIDAGTQVLAALRNHGWTPA